MPMQSSTLVKLRKVRLASVAAATYPFTGLLTVDGEVTAAEDLVLMKDQVTGSQNGLYVVKADAWVRDYETGVVDPDLTSGAMFTPTAGSQVNQIWRITTADPITWGTTAVSFAQVGGGGVSDHKVSIDGSDSTYDYLNAKLTVSAPMTKTVVGEPGPGTLNLATPTMVASGAGHAPGLVPDPPAIAGAVKYLREDGTWVVPPVGGGGTFGTGQITFAGQRAVVTIADAGVGATSHCQAFLMAEGAAPSGFTAEEHNFLKPYVGLTCGNIVPGVSFDVVGISQLTLNGTLNIHWQRG